MFNKLVFKNLKLKKLSTSLIVVASLLVAQVTFADKANAAGATENIFLGGSGTLANLCHIIIRNDAGTYIDSVIVTLTFFGELENE